MIVVAPIGLDLAALFAGQVRLGGPSAAETARAVIGRSTVIPPGGSFCAWPTSTAATAGWSRPASDSSDSPAPNPTAASRCFSTWPAIDGICWKRSPPPDDRRHPRRTVRAAPPGHRPGLQSRVARLTSRFAPPNAENWALIKLCEPVCGTWSVRHRARPQRTGLMSLRRHGNTSGDRMSAPV